MGGSKRAALVTLLLFSLLLFQNCSSSLMSGSDQISNTSQQNSPNIATDLIQPISLVIEKEDSIFRGDRVNISISKSDFNFPDEFIVQTVSATAQSGFDFINIDRKFNFENNQDVIQLSIETLISDPFAEDKSLIIKIKYFTEQGETREIEKNVLIQSKYTKARFKEIKATYFNSCGLGFDDQVYCWPLQIGVTTNYNFHPSQRIQPKKIVLASGQKINFSSLKMGGGICFTTTPLNKLYCPNYNLLFHSNSPDNQYIVQDADLVFDNVKDFIVTPTAVYFLNLSGLLHYRRFFDMSDYRIATSSKSFEKIFAYGYYGCLAVTSENEYSITDSNGNLAQLALPLEVTRLNFRNIIGHNLFYLFTNQRTRIFTGYLAPGVIPETSIPEDYGNSYFAESPCYVSTNNNWICNNVSGKAEKQFNLLEMGLSNGGIYNARYNDFCGLKLNGDLVCKSSGTESDQIVYLFSKNNRFSDYIDLTEEKFLELSNNPTTYFLDDPKLLSFYKNCTINDEIVSCYGFKPFGNEKIKFATLKINPRHTTVLPEIIAESKSGRKLAFGHRILESQVAEQIYILKN